MTNSKIFVIECKGRCATQWLAALFNTVPEISCWHGWFMPDETQYEGAMAFDVKTTADRMLQQAATRRYAHVGNVHGSEQDEAIVRAIEDAGVSVSRAALIRHPADRIISFAAKWTNNANARADLEKSYVAMARQLSRAVDLATHFRGEPLDLYALNFIRACEMIPLFDSVLLQSGKKIFRHEDYTRDTNSLLELALVALDGDRTQATKIAARGKTFPPRNQTEYEALTPETRWSRLDPWQRQFFTAYFSHQQDDFIRCYGQINTAVSYDVAFMFEPKSDYIPVDKYDLSSLGLPK